jgi:hypothetical protein
MKVSRAQVVAALAVVCLSIVVCAYLFLGEGARPTVLIQPAIRAAEYPSAQKATDEIVADHGPSARIAAAAKAPSPTPPPIEESKPVDPRVAEEAQWEKEFAGLKRSDLTDASWKLGEKLGDLALEPLMAEFDAGRYEVIGHGKTDSSDHTTEGVVEVHAVQYRQDSDEIRKAVLSEAKYPELYAMRRKVLWLETQAQRPELQD